MVNLKIRDFENRLVKMIDEEPLPIEIKNLVVGDIHRRLIDLSDKTILAEKQSLKEEQAKKENDQNEEEGAEI